MKNSVRLKLIQIDFTAYFFPKRPPNNPPNPLFFLFPPKTIPATSSTILPSPSASSIDSKKLFFTYVRSSKFKAAHMVLTYFETPRSEPLILDNNNHKIFPASKRKDLTPVYNFNGESLYRASKTGAGKKVKSQKSHKKWDELKLNMKRKKI